MKRILLFFTLLVFVFQVEGQSIIRANPYYKAVASGYAARSSDYQAVYNAMPTKPSAANALIDDDFFFSLDSLFTAESITLHYMNVYASQYEDGSLINWVNPGTNDADLPTATTWTTLEGYTGDNTPSGDYISTNFNPTTASVAQNSASAGLYIRNNSQSDGYVFGTNSTNDWYIRVRSTGDIVTARLNTTADQTGASANSSGFWIMTRRAVDDIEIYRNGASVDTEADASTAVPDAELLVLATSGGTSRTPYQVSLTIITSGMTDDQATKTNTIVERRMDRLGTGVE